MAKFLKLAAILIPVGAFVFGWAAWSIATELFSGRLSSVGKIPSDPPGYIVSFSSKSGGKISGWLFPGTRNQGIVLMHGKDGDRRSMMGRARFLNAAGYSILVFDFQAHGESPGEYTTYGYIESLDAHAAVEFLRSELGSCSVGIVGFSLGGAAAIIGPQGPLQVDAMVLEAVYPTIEEAFANRVRMHLGFYNGWFYQVFALQLRLLLGIDPKDLRPIERIHAIEAPVFIIAGEEDRHTTLEESKRLYASANDPKDLWVISHAHHGNFYKRSPEAYTRRVLQFFSRFMENSTCSHALTS